MSYNLLFQKTYDLVKWVYPTVNKFLRKHRLILSQRIEVTSIRLLELVIDLNQRDTATNKRKILYEVHKLQILFRLCKDLSYLNFKKYEYVSSLLEEIGGYLGMNCKNLYNELCSFRNLGLAYKKARKGKRNKTFVREFEFNLERNLLQLKHELETFTYKSRPLRQFVIRDPKTRIISASHFRDRVVHHAICNIIQPVFEKAFIHDSYANQSNNGTHAALRRLDRIKRKATENGRLVNGAKDNNMVIGYVFKADIRHYFETGDHEILLRILESRLKDERLMCLIRKILGNHNTKNPGKGMPLGNLTSQLFANVYLNQLDYFVKHELNAKHYIRYVDDFVILHRSMEVLLHYKERIKEFLMSIKLELHQEKSKISPLHKGTKLVGYRVFYYYKLPKKSNIIAFKRRRGVLMDMLMKREMPYKSVVKSIDGWLAYASHANTLRLRKKLLLNCYYNVI